MSSFCRRFSYAFALLTLLWAMPPARTIGIVMDTPQTGPNFVVNSTGDADDGTCGVNNCALREAINAANNVANATITFDATAFSAAQTITLGSSLPHSTANLTITGPAAGVTIGNSGRNYSAFEVDSGTFVCSGLTLNGNYIGLDIVGGSGTAQNCTLSGNTDGLYIGAGSGAAQSCTLSGNTTGFYINGGSGTAHNCALSGNNTGLFSSGGSSAAQNCTFANNSAGLFILGGSSAAQNCTFTNNNVGLNLGGGTYSLNNSIVAGNTNVDIQGTVTTDGGYNLIGTKGAGGLTNGTNHDQVGVSNPGLGALGSNGGPTQTVALQAGSPAIDAGNSTVPFDQRGFKRPVDGGSGTATPDIGAYEYGSNVTVQIGPNFVVHQTTDTDDGACSPTTCTLRDAIKAANGTGGTNAITFDPAVFGASRQTITLTGGLPTISSNTTITAPAAGVIVHGTTAGGNPITPPSVFQIASGTVVLSGLTITGASASINANADVFTTGGNVTVKNCTLTGSTTAINDNANLNVTVQNCTLTGNDTAFFDVDGTITAQNCTVTGNSSELLVYVTTSGNPPASYFNAANTLFVGDPNDLATNFGGDHCLYETTPTAAGLDPNGLQENGGPTRTIALLTGSPAIDAGNSPLFTDQRGLPRPSDFNGVANASGGNGSDIGAFELQAPANQQAGPGFVVNSIADTDDGACTDTDCTLREAVNAANNAGGTNAITFALPALLIHFSDNAAHPTITAAGAGGATGTVTPANNGAGQALRVTGSSGTYTLTYQGQTTSPLPYNATAGQVQSSLNALSTIGGAGLMVTVTPTATAPALITLNATLPTITSNLSITGPAASVTISGNSNYNIFKLTSGTFTGSNLTLDDDGDGLDISGGSGTMQNCTFAGTGDGIAIIGGSGTAQDCAFTGNHEGIEIYTGSGTAQNCTFAGNADAGFNIFGGTVTAQNCTFTGNKYGLNFSGGGGSTLSLSNSLVAGNTTADIHGTVTSGSYNLIGTGGTSGNTGQGGLTNGSNGNQVNVSNAGLDPNGLQNNGGPTPTIALLSGSPAIDAGDPGVTAAPTSYDQRGPGYARVYGSRLDIGAYEAQPLSELTVSQTPTTATLIPGANFTATLTVTNSGPDAATNVVVSGATPANTTLVSLTQTSGPTFTLTPPNGNTGSFTATRPSLANGATATFSLVLRVNNSTPDNTTIANTVTATTTQTHPVINPASASVTVNTAISGTSGNNTLVVTATGPDSGTYSLNGGPAVSFTGLPALNFSGAGGNDTLIISNPASGLFAPAGGITFNGGGQTGTPGDSLQIVGGAETTATYTYGASDANGHGGTIDLVNGTTDAHYTYSGLEPISNTGTATNIIFNLPGTADTATLTDSGGTTKLTSTNGTFETTTVTTPLANGSVTINAGAGDDTLNVTPSSYPILIDGGTGNNTLNVNLTGATSPVFTTTGANAGAVAFGNRQTVTYQNIQTVTPANQAPVNTVPGAQTVAQGGTLTFSATNHNAISIADADAGGAAVQIALSATHGSVTLSTLNGLTVTGGSNAGASVTAQGTLAALNAALNGLTFTPTSGYNGAASLNLVTSDLGHTGAGGAQSAISNVAITVTPAPTPTPSPTPIPTPTPAPTNGNISLGFSNVGNGDVFRGFPTLVGSVSETNAGPDTTLTVQISIQRQSDGKYFNGSAFSATPTLFPATTSNGVFILPSGVLPGANGQAVGDDKYKLTALATDNNGGSNRASIVLIIDHTAPRITITTPDQRPIHGTLQVIGGKATDAPGGTGVQRVLLSIIRVSDGKTFDGTYFVPQPKVNGKAQPLVLTTSYDPKSGSWARRAGLPYGTSSLPGAYRILAIAIDGAGNRAQATSSYTVYSTLRSAPAASGIALSTSSASAATSSVTLKFLGALAAESASDAAHYTVTVNGKAVTVESAGYNATSHSVTLGLPEGSLKSGDAVVVKWSGLQDSKGAAVAGQSGAVTAR